VIEGDFQASNWLDLQRLHHNRLKERAVSHNDQRTRIAPLIRKRVDRATHFATKVDLVTAQYPVEKRREIAELLRILAAKPEAPDVRL
jgi:hypothetical protein